MSRFLLYTRYLVLIPILGLSIAAAFFFIFGGIGLISLLFGLLFNALGLTPGPVEMEQGVIINKIFCN